MRQPRTIWIENGLCHIPLTKGYVAIADEGDFSLICGAPWRVNLAAGVYAVRHDPVLFEVTKDRGRSIIGMHRLLMGQPCGLVVDHINGNTLDNRRTNLRAITAAQNAKNLAMNRNNKSGVSGVSWHPEKNAWAAAIWVGGKNIHLGTFKDIELARLARAEAEVKYFGEFARSA